MDEESFSPQSVYALGKQTIENWWIFLWILKADWAYFGESISFSDPDISDTCKYKNVQTRLKMASSVLNGFASTKSPSLEPKVLNTELN